jgi:predicted DNA-binding transcriptional regulator AlpA
MFNDGQLGPEESNMAALPETGYLRLAQIVGRPATNDAPGIPAIYPVSKSTWWAGVRAGRYPKPVKLGERITAWRVEDIRQLIEQVAA